jgi:hypothetical protein
MASAIRLSVVALFFTALLSIFRSASATLMAAMELKILNCPLVSMLQNLVSLLVMLPRIGCGKYYKHIMVINGASIVFKMTIG